MPIVSPPVRPVLRARHIHVLLPLLALVAVPGWAHAACGPVRNAEQLLEPGVRLLVGEMHGNSETERVFGDLVCLAAQKGPVRVGLEIPSDEQSAISAFLASAGTPADRQALLVGKFWTNATQDGRGSTAMVGLIETIRQLRRRGADVDITPFDVTRAVPDRDRAMADRLLADFARAPNAAYLVLVGNIHARRNPGRFQKVVMAASLVERGTTITTIAARYGLGTTWACFSACGPQVTGNGPPASPGVALEKTKDGAYDGFLDVGAPSFSPPAAVPTTAEQKSRAGSVKQRLAALSAYADKKYARCAEAFSELARRIPDDASDDAYSAACCHALAGDAERALAQLAVAAEKGFKDVNALAKDPDLASLHADRRWDMLLDRVRRNSVPSPPQAK